MVEGVVQIFLRQRIAEVHNTRNKPSSALADIYRKGFIHLCLAALASELRNISMQFSQQLRPNPGTQMEVIHILRDEELQLTQVLELDNGSMASIGLGRSEGSCFWR
jgi:hypothetical protein